MTASDFDSFMSTHVVDVPLLRADDFDAYFIERAKGLLRLISDAMGKPITNLEREDIVEAFGAVLKQK